MSLQPSMGLVSPHPRRWSPLVLGIAAPALVASALILWAAPAPPRPDHDAWGRIYFRPVSPPGAGRPAPVAPPAPVASTAVPAPPIPVMTAMTTEFERPMAQPAALATVAPPVAIPPAIPTPPQGEMPAVGGPLPPDRPWDWTASATGGSPADPLPFMEGHWQGLEVIPLWPNLRRALAIPPAATGVVVDEITQPADGQGFIAGDLVMVVGRLPTPTVADFLAAADAVRDGGSVDIIVLRQGEVRSLTLSAPRLGSAAGETAPMIPPGAPRPHGYQGPCTNCHRIGTIGSIPVDPGDLFPLTAPPILAGQRATHRDYGPCRTCHTIQ